MKHRMTRRTVMQIAAGAAAGVLIGTRASAETTVEKPLRMVHLTDMHVPAAGKGIGGLEAALAAVAKLDPAPAFLITGGDHVMETFNATRESMMAQWAMYARALAGGTKLKVYPVMGNHDVWGWSLPDRSLEKDPRYGKAMAMEQLGMNRSYYSFDAGPWHFVVLDSVTRRGNDYVALLGEAQMEWLKADLAAVPKGRPICVVSHIPILAACVFFDGERLREDHWHVPDRWMHRDAAELLSLLAKHAVKLAISGHIHLYDVVEYNSVKFICDGAVCGNWWKGCYHETPAGFGVFDLFADGRVEHSYMGFAWKA